MKRNDTERATNCYLSRNYKGLTSAGNKAKTDIERIMRDMGYRNVGLPQTTYTNKVLSFLLTLAGVLKAPFCLHQGDRLVLQYPLKKYFAFVCNMAHARGAKVVVIIHDLGSFRRKALTEEQEIRRLNHGDYIIAHNAHMKQWLEERGCKPPIGELGIFDYLSDTRATTASTIEKPFSVVYAGALNPRKNTFLYEVGAHISSFQLCLYGNGFDLSQAKGKEHIKCMGFVKSDDLIATAQGHFGLTWDGFSIDGCTGNFGEYLQYNNPHKTSLYIRCGLPIIIWSKAALADFVSSQGIGICVDSLAELDARLQALTIEEYRAMKSRAMRLSDQLAEGHFVRTAMGRAFGELLP